MTKKKTILEEGTVRRFMKLANIGTLSENYFSDEELYNEEDEEEEVVVGDELDAEPMDVEPEMDAEPAVSAEVATELVSAITDAVEDVIGVPIEVTGAEEPPMEEPEMDLEPEVDMEPEMEEPAEDAEAYRNEEAATPCGECGHVVSEEEATEEEVVAEAEEEVVAEEEAEEETEEVVSEDEGPQTITNEELVNYISQRVAKRLEEKKKA